MRISDVIIENFDREKANQALSRYNSKSFPRLSDSDITMLQTVIDEAKQKLVTLINSRSDIRADFSKFKEWFGRNESQLMRMRHDSLQNVGIIVDAGSRAPLVITQDNKIKVSTELNHIIQWRFIIMDAEHALQGINKGNSGPPVKTFTAHFQRLAHFV